MGERRTHGAVNQSAGRDGRRRRRMLRHVRNLPCQLSPHLLVIFVNKRWGRMRVSCHLHPDPHLALVLSLNCPFVEESLLIISSLFGQFYVCLLVLSWNIISRVWLSPHSCPRGNDRDEEGGAGWNRETRMDSRDACTNKQTSQAGIHGIMTQLTKWWQFILLIY